MLLEFTVHGIPQTQGSKRAFPFKRRNGSLGVAVSDDNPKGKAWKSQVADAARAALKLETDGTALYTGPLVLEIVFALLRPKAHYRTGRNSGCLRGNAPRFPAVKPDALKLARAVEDALTGIVWRDDAQVIHLTAAKVYGTRAGAFVRIRQAPGIDPPTLDTEEPELLQISDS